MKLRPGHLGTIGLLVFLALALAGIFAPVLGWRLDVVQSGSMEPSIGVGSLEATAPGGAENIGVGDVISFHAEGGAMVCHRVVSIEGQTFITKGDANEDNDPSAVHFDHVEGKVAFSVPYIGYVVGFLKTPLGWLLMGLLVVLVLVVGSGKKADAGEGGR